MNEFEKTIRGRLQYIEEEMSDIRKYRAHLDKSKWSTFDEAIQTIVKKREGVEEEVSTLPGLAAAKRAERKNQIRSEMTTLENDIYHVKETYSEKEFGLAGMLGF